MWFLILKSPIVRQRMWQILNHSCWGVDVLFVVMGVDWLALNKANSAFIFPFQFCPFPSSWWRHIYSKAVITYCTYTYQGESPIQLRWLAWANRYSIVLQLLWCIWFEGSCLKCLEIYRVCVETSPTESGVSSYTEGSPQEQSIIVTKYGWLLQGTVKLIKLIYKQSRGYHLTVQGWEAAW